MGAVRAVVVDIEGTTSATAAVHGALFDDARRHLPTWVADHAAEPDVASALDEVRALAGLAPTAPEDEVVAVLARWIDEDVKATPLKAIQGRIWAEGFAEGRLAAHVYDDVAPALRRWAADGIGLGVFSSGAVSVQQPWFAAAPGGDLSELFDAWFDTANAGPKRDAASYVRIAEAVAHVWSSRPSQLLFLSDVPAELDAATAAGWQAVGVRRPGEPFGTADFGPHPTVASLADLSLVAADRVAS